jgi:glyoxylase-like metal-dependent hydrolase (beta-lactamase superfamily II)
MSLDRRTFLHISGSAAAVSALAVQSQSVYGKAPLAETQAPSYYRFKTGTLEITAVTDGMLELPLALFPAADKPTADGLLAKAHRAEKAQTAVNTYLINTGDKLILVDTGYGTMAGAAAGYLQANLKAAGFEPSQIDTVIITHLHPDHVGGLLDAQGKPVFPNAALLVGEREHTYWNDAGITSRAPADAQKFFKIAQDATKPYGGQLHLYKNGEELAPGIVAAAAPGHTPGHTTLRLSSGKDTMLIWGDIVHVAALQFAKPEWGIAFDTDIAQAVETRKALMDQLASDGTLVAGMHLDFPGIGYVAKEAQGYSFQRAMWSPSL